MKNNISSIVWEKWDNFINEAFAIFITEFHSNQKWRIRIVPYRKTIRGSSKEGIHKWSEDLISSILFELWIFKGEYPVYDKLLIDKVNKYLQWYVNEHCTFYNRCVNELMG